MRKFTCLIILSLFMISFASALEIDNVKSYNEELRVVTITNALGMGDVIGQARLNTPQNLRVGLGYQKVAEFDIWAYQDYNDAIKQFTFTDMKKKEKINRNFDLKYLTYEEIQINKYIEVPVGTMENGTIIYETQINGSYPQLQEKWTKVTPADLKKNDILTIGIFTDVQKGDHVDWVPTIYGVKIEEWAEWTADLNTNLTSYYNLDETSGTTAFDSLFLNNGTNNGADVNVTGKLGTAYDFEASQEDTVNLGAVIIPTTGDFTIDAWIKPESKVPDSNIIKQNAGGTGRFGFGVKGETDLQAYIFHNGGPGTMTSTTSMNTGEWYYITARRDSGNMSIWVNGVLEVSQTDSAALESTNTLISGTGGTAADGVIDEVGFWARALSDAEIVQRYNGGNGITYTNETGAESPVVTLNSPANDSTLSSQSITFNCTASDAINLDNVTLYVDGIANGTNTSGINNSVYLFQRTLPTGDYNWTCGAINNASLETIATTRTFDVNTTLSLAVNAISPVDEYNSTSSNINFNCTSTDSNGITHVNLTINGTVYETDTGGVGQNVTMLATETLSNGHYDWNCTALNIYGDIVTSETRGLNVSSVDNFEVTLNSPANASSFIVSDVDFNCSAKDNGGIENISLVVDDVVLETDVGPGNTNLTLTSTETLTDGDHTWYCTANNGTTWKNSTESRTLSIDTTPFINFISPTESNASSKEQSFIQAKVNLTEDYFQNITFTLYNGSGQLDSTTFTNLSRELNWSGLATGDYYYNVTTFTSTGKSNSTETRKITLFVIGQVTWDNSAYYQMENTSVIDSTGNGNDGTNSGTSQVTGKINNALDFEESESDYINITKALLPTNTSDYTISAWIKPESTGAEASIVTQYDGVDPGRFNLEMNATNYINVFQGGASFTSTSTVGTDAWTSIALRRESGNTSLWINGTYQSSSTLLNESILDTYTLIGAITGNFYFDGIIDEVGFWNRAISDDEIFSLWNLSRGSAFTGTSNVSITLITAAGLDSYETETTPIYLNTSVVGKYASVKINNISLYTNEGSSWSIYNTVDLSSDNYSSYVANFSYSIMNLHEDRIWGIKACDKSSICYSSPNRTVDFNNITFVKCNATYSDDFLNISFLDETNLSTINATIPYSNFTYYLGNGSLTKTYEFTNTSVNYNYSFCASPTTKTFYVNPYVQYKNGIAYPQRIWDDTIQTFTSAVTNKILYLVNTLSGQQVTFQVVNQGDQVISGVAVTAVRSIGGVDVTVGSGTTSDAGAVTFFLNPDFEHSFTFVKTGFEVYSTTYRPTESSYTIYLGEATTPENSSVRGILRSIIPLEDFLENDTEYTFGFNLTSSYSDVTEYGFNLRLANGTIITGDSTSVMGTQLTKVYDVNNQSTIYLDYYWIVNGEYVNSSRYWAVQNTEYASYSIMSFFTDFDSYMASGIYGLDNFGRNLIVFLILVITIGIFSYKYGIVNPIGLTSLMFSIVFFFDVVVGLIPTLRGIENLPTFIMGLILVLTILSEARSK